MKAMFPTEVQLNKTLIAALTLMVGAIGLLLCSPRSHAQQEPNRQLVQTGSASASAGKRIALVIGNGAYTKAPPLKNPPNDARDMAATLKALGFEVSNGINVNQREMKRLIREFGQKLKAGGNGLFYYAGHGVQARGHNYIIPVDADIQSEADVEDSGVDVGLVLNYMDDAQNGLNIVILDACRNNPFSRSFRSASEGLAQVDAPTGTLIAYATAPGRVAADGVGENGLYTSELLKAMRLPGLSATDMFMQVRAEVMKRTGNKQVPWEASSLVGSFYFSGSPTNLGFSNVGANNAAPSEPKFDPAAFELSYWETIKSSTSPEDFKAYLEKYPNGQFASLAKIRLAAVAPSDSTRTETGVITTPASFVIVKEILADGSNNGWTNAGLVARRGQRLRISASGKISIDAKHYSIPAGSSNVNDEKRLMRNEPTGALIAVIGDDNDDFIFIGANRDFVAARDGVLFLGVNESNLNDNKGVYEARIEAEAVFDVSVESGKYAVA
ncbi:MAG: caspase family protein, partial [Acidobacteriota bacterium]|nr:caspase family protein [Acidobacteriota bacterium]